jgi:hypothetical protein
MPYTYAIFGPKSIILVKTDTQMIPMHFNINTAYEFSPRMNNNGIRTRANSKFKRIADDKEGPSE